MNDPVQQRLGIAGFDWADLHDPGRLEALHGCFEHWLAETDPSLHGRFVTYHQCQGAGHGPPDISGLLVELAPRLSEFIARLFCIEAERDAQITAIRQDNAVIFALRAQRIQPLLKRFARTPPPLKDADQVQRRMRVLLRYPAWRDTTQDAELRFCRLGAWLYGLSEHGSGDGLEELKQWLLAEGHRALFAELFSAASDDAAVASLVECLEHWVYAASLERREPGSQVEGWLCFKTPARVVPQDLVPHQQAEHGPYPVWRARAGQLRRRDGFVLTDPRCGEREAQYEADLCIYCHERDTDSCSKGMRARTGQGYRSGPLGTPLTGCPLEQKISEMNLLKQRGDNIAALALVIIDNPMCPGTGHRICNDCMKGCIYQKTEPVNIPQVETNVLSDVLFMPWGFEIYSLLTRWNPLNVRRPYALPCNGKKVLVVGLGPAGYTLAHYLINEGFAVVGIDALKLEPLPVELTGDGDSSPLPIRDFRAHYQSLDERSVMGFGGVAEYGITVRWDKNFLNVIYLNLLRRDAFRCFGGVRFGGTVTIEDAWELGFDHIAIATGAGKPTIIGMQNNLARGVRKASDFLMSLQLSGAARRSSLANLQFRLPAGVVGGGLTAIDTATELMAYYPVQVEKMLYRYESVCARFGVETVRARFDEEERLVLDEFLAHGRELRAERERARRVGERPDFHPLLERWGGVTLFYRKGIQDSPAYRQNHEEVREALREGIRLAEGMSPLAALEDEYGALVAVRFAHLRPQQDGWQDTGERSEVPLRSLFIAAGTAPNTIYQQEYPGTFEMDRRFFQRHEPRWTRGAATPELVPTHDETVPKQASPAPFTSWCRDGRHISFYGDNHPVYAGSVVKAMASARDGYPYIVRLFRDELARLDSAGLGDRLQQRAAFFARLAGLWEASVVAIRRLAPDIVEVLVRAPMQARKFQPGQFYRVQNLEANAPRIEDTLLLSEGLALTGAWVDKERGLISLITLEMGASSRLCALWREGDRLSVMGVTGTATRIPKHSTVMLIGGGLGNAVQFSIGKALRAAGSRVIYFAGYRRAEGVFKMEEIEAASDVVVWSIDPGTGVAPITATRPQDSTHVGNIIDAMEAYARGELGEVPIPLDQVEHIIAIGSDRMMNAVKEARHGRLKPYLNPTHRAIGSINSPMQCMMKGVCAQCLCRHISPKSGEPYYVYSCYNQDQELDRVDFSNLNARLRQNSVQEKLSDLWVDHLLAAQADG